MKEWKSTTYGIFIFISILVVLENTMLLIFTGMSGVIFIISNVATSALLLVLVIVAYIIIKEIKELLTVKNWDYETSIIITIEIFISTIVCLKLGKN